MRLMNRRRPITVLASAALAVGAGIFVAPSAHASGWGCSGTQIDTYAVKTPSGTTWGTVHLYYNSSTGKNCAVNVLNAAGGEGTLNQEVSVYLYKCPAGTKAGDACNVTDDDDADSGVYAYYAGPTTMSAVDRCVRVEAYIVKGYMNGAKYIGKADHCS